jgi:DNA-binding CsgD family transcriptional regulator
MSEKTVNQLQLWAFGTPAATLAKYLGLTESNREDGSIRAVSVTLQKRKTLAAALGLTQKGDKGKLDIELKKLGIDLKTAFGKEVTGIVGSAEWIGTRGRVATSKDGTQTASFTFKRVGEVTPKISKEDAVKALLASGMSEEEILDMVVNQQKSEAPAIDLEKSNVEAPVGQMEQAAS